MFIAWSLNLINMMFQELQDLMQEDVFHDPRY